jgi:hypothetical protein
MIEVFVSRLGLDAASNTYVLILQERGGYRVLPVWIGQAEAEAIIVEINDVERTRPMTHDLCRRMVLALGGTVEKISITHVHNNTYYAELEMRKGDSIIQVDARPSDSIALALRFSAPIFASESLLSHGLDIESSVLSDPHMQMPPQGEDDPTFGDARRRLSAEQLKKHLENMRPEDFGKFNL